MHGVNQIPHFLKKGVKAKLDRVGTYRKAMGGKHTSRENTNKQVEFCLRWFWGGVGKRGVGIEERRQIINALSTPNKNKNRNMGGHEMLVRNRVRAAGGNPSKASSSKKDLLRGGG